MAKQVIEFDGFVTETLPGGKFRVALEDQNREIVAILSGKMRLHRIKIVTGDRVKVELSPYDLNNGRLSFRYSGRPQATMPVADPVDEELPVIPSPQKKDPATIDSEIIPEGEVEVTI